MGTADAPLVLVITAWQESDGIRARILYGDRHATGPHMCGSLADLLRALEEAVAEWQRHDPPET